MPEISAMITSQYVFYFNAGPSIEIPLTITNIFANVSDKIAVLLALVLTFLIQHDSHSDPFKTYIGPFTLLLTIYCN
jgi:fructose-specific phosphotransferase system IIC component